MTNANVDRPEWDAYDDFTGVEPPQRWRDPALPVTLYDTLVPLDAEEQYVPNHLDADGTVHFFAAVDVSNEPEGNDRAPELRYFRAAQTDDGRLIHDAHPVMPLPNSGADPFPRQTLETMLMDGDLDTAQELAYQTAQAHGLPFPEPEALPTLNTGVDYRFDLGIEGDGSPTLEAVKSWRDGALDHEERVTIASYGMAEALEVDLRELNDLRARDGLEAALNLAESMAVASGYLHDGRADPRLFTAGPPDPFMTLAEHDRAVEAGVVFTFDDEDTQPLPAVTLPEPGSWEALLEQERDRVETEPEPYYWQMHYRPVATPEGDPLGTALFVTEYPQFPPDLEAYFDETGVSTFYPTRARTLEMAHFTHEEDARKFEMEFRSYLVPGLLDGPELAPEVAKLEGLSGEWQELDDRGIVDMMSGDRPLVRDTDDWHRHDPHAEREAELQVNTDEAQDNDIAF